VIFHVASRQEYLEGYRNIYGVRVTGLIDNFSQVRSTYFAPNPEAPYPLDYIVGRDGRVRLWETEYKIREVVDTVKELLAEENVANVTATSSTEEISRGLQLPYKVSVTNNSPQIQSFEAWGEEIQPDSSRVRLWGPFPVQLNPGQTVTVNLSELIPQTATLGNHSLKVKIGYAYPDSFFDVDGFDFIVN